MPKFTGCSPTTGARGKSRDFHRVSEKVTLSACGCHLCTIILTLGRFFRITDRGEREWCLVQVPPRLTFQVGMRNEIRQTSKLSLIHISEPTRQAEISY